MSEIDERPPWERDFETLTTPHEIAVADAWDLSQDMGQKLWARELELRRRIAELENELAELRGTKGDGEK